MGLRKAQTIVVAGIVALSVVTSGQCDELPTTPIFFPSGTFNEFKTKWYEDVLMVLDEPSLLGAGGRKIRFLYIPSFTQPVVVRWTNTLTEQRSLS